MLKQYAYIDHSCTVIHNFMDKVFLVWCDARNNQARFSPDVFQKQPNEYSILVLIEKNAKILFSLLAEIHELFRNLDAAAVNKLKQFYEANNNIENAVADHSAPVGTYTDVACIDGVLSEKLRDLYDLLWKKGFGYVCFNKPDISDHYRVFVRKNGRTCRFCGLLPLPGERVKYRSDYDHFLTKSIYPFNAVNLKNLVPMCSECNQKCKKTKDVLLDGKKSRRKAFPPYGDDSRLRVTLQVTIGAASVAADGTCVVPGKLAIGLTGPDKEEIETWRDVFDIEERYLDELDDVFEDWAGEYKELNDVPESPLLVVKGRYEKRPLQEKNFLKYPFFEAFSALEKKAKKNLAQK